MFKRKVIVDLKGLSCISFGDCVESTSHLFVTYSLAYSVWYRIFKLLGVQLTLYREPMILLSFSYL